MVAVFALVLFVAGAVVGINAWLGSILFEFGSVQLGATLMALSVIIYLLSELASWREEAEG